MLATPRRTSSTSTRRSEPVLAQPRRSRHLKSNAEFHSAFEQVVATGHRHSCADVCRAGQGHAAGLPLSAGHQSHEQLTFDAGNKDTGAPFPGCGVRPSSAAISCSQPCLKSQSCVCIASSLEPRLLYLSTAHPCRKAAASVHRNGSSTTVSPTSSWRFHWHQRLPLRGLDLQHRSRQHRCCDASPTRACSARAMIPRSSSPTTSDH